MKEQIGQALLEAIESIKNSELLTGAALLAAISSIVVTTGALIWRYGKGAWSYVYSRIRRKIVFIATIEHFSDMYWYMETWLFENHKSKYRNVIAFTDSSEIPTDIITSANPYGEKSPVEVEDTENEPKPKKRVVLKHHQDFIIIKYKGRRLYISKLREKNEGAATFTSLFYDTFIIRTIFGRKIVPEFLDFILKYNLSKIIDKVDIDVRISEYNNWQTLRGIVPKTLNAIFLNGNIKDRVISDVRKFKASEQYYVSRGIPYKRGYLLHGKPGNGKTSLAMAIAFELNMNINILNLSNLDDDTQLLSLYRRLSSSDGILLIEDIDTMFIKNREVGRKKVSFSTLLNCMDGALYSHGVITIITTNHLHKLDPALLRKGRVDLIEEIDDPETSTIKSYIDNFYNTTIGMNGELDGLKAPMSSIQELCLSNSEETIKDALIEYKSK